jgi:myo-inositol-1(or 4)-monophosphatase
VSAQPDVSVPSAADLDTLVALLRAAAHDEVMPRFRRTDASAKADGSLVTEADLAVQQRVIDACRARWPGIPLLGEEMPADEQQQLIGDGDAAFWCLDPLDGTGNFASGLPIFAISLALIRGGEPQLAVILDPVRDECFTAARGAGAQLDGEPIAPFAPGGSLSDSLAVVDFKRMPPERVAPLFRSGSFRSQRNLGSVALEWCWLAAGRFQLYLHGGQKLWDYAAGRLIADEAGAVAALFAPDDDRPAVGVSLEKRVAVGAADRRLFDQWLAFIGMPLRQ